MSRLFSDVLPEWPLDEVESGLASATETDVLAALELAENGRRLNARDSWRWYLPPPLRILKRWPVLPAT